MNWSLHRWAWLIEAPLFVGAPPAGSLNRCRPYVPARGIWGALTAELAQASATGFPDYQQRGASLRECARFTYLYPAELVKGAWRAWLPDYVPTKGLVWRREDHTTASCAPVSDRQFRRWIIDARLGTAIDPESDTAAEATLRETECVMTNWRAGRPSCSEPVALVGYLFLKDMSAADLEAATTLFIGGDTRYGLGRLRRIEFEKADRVFEALPTLDCPDPFITNSRLLAHGQSNGQLQGAKEALTVWDRTASNPLLSIAALHWAPGSRSSEEVRWRIDQDGIWHDLL